LLGSVDHNTNMRAAASALAEGCFNNTGQLLQVADDQWAYLSAKHTVSHGLSKAELVVRGSLQVAGEMIDPLDKLMSGNEMTITEDVNNIDDIGNYDFLYYVDEVVPETPRGVRASLSKYVDDNGIPIPPKNYADLASRRATDRCLRCRRSAVTLHCTLPCRSCCHHCRGHHYRCCRRPSDETGAKSSQNRPPRSKSSPESGLLFVWAVGWLTVYGRLSAWRQPHPLSERSCAGRWWW
jgi:hypothetical protein